MACGPVETWGVNIVTLLECGPYLLKYVASYSFLHVDFDESLFQDLDYDQLCIWDGSISYLSIIKYYHCKIVILRAEIATLFRVLILNKHN
jgi:hypothetical protein